MKRYLPLIGLGLILAILKTLLVLHPPVNTDPVVANAAASSPLSASTTDLIAHISDSNRAAFPAPSDSSAPERARHDASGADASAAVASSHSVSSASQSRSPAPDPAQ
jgi:hypothetical protein